jgi:hypothetical protein
VSPPARRVAPLLLLALLATGCPLPQAVPSRSGTTAAPPRILQDGSLLPAATRIPFDPGCARPQSFDVHATVEFEAGDAVEYRWFVDYQNDNQSAWTPLEQGVVQQPTQEPRTLRPLPAFAIRPADFGTARVHVLDLAVSNNFLGDSAAQATLPDPWRTPAPGFRVQSYRWVFEPLAGSGNCPP